MNRTLKSGEIVVFDDKHHVVRLNGSTVYLTCGSNTISIARKRAELLTRVTTSVSSTPVSPTKQATTSTSTTTATTTTTIAVTKSAEDKREKLKGLLKKNCLAEIDLEKLCDEVMDALGDGKSKGGVYLVRIDEVAGKSVKFWRGDTETDEFVLVKFGKADVYADRFRQFKFQFTVAMKVDGNTTMESELKRTIPANWKLYYFDMSKKNATVLKAIGCEGNNGPSEWRIMRRASYEEIKRRADAELINSLNWRHHLQIANPLMIKEKELKIEVGIAGQLVNSKMFQVY